VQRDSAYAKIQRGKINSERVKYLDSALVMCDSTKTIKTKVIGIQEVQIDSLFKVISKDNKIINVLGDNITLEKKRGRRRAFWSFLKGTAVGALLMAVLSITI